MVADHPSAKLTGLVDLTNVSERYHEAISDVEAVIQRVSRWDDLPSEEKQEYRDLLGLLEAASARRSPSRVRRMIGKLFDGVRTQRGRDFSRFLRAIEDLSEQIRARVNAEYAAGEAVFASLPDKDDIARKLSDARAAVLRDSKADRRLPN